MLHWNSCPTRNMAFSENMLLNLMVHLLVGVFAHRYYLTVTISKGIGPSNECRNQHRSTPQETLRCQPASCHTSPLRLLVARARGLGPTPGAYYEIHMIKLWEIMKSEWKWCEVLIYLIFPGWIVKMISYINRYGYITTFQEHLSVTAERPKHSAFTMWPGLLIPPSAITGTL